MKKNKKEIDVRYIILIIIVIFLLIINLILILKNVIEPKQKENQTTANSVKYTTNNTSNYKVPQTDEEIIKYLASLGEGNRIEYYCGKFINLIKEKQYEKAYKLLYSEFKEKYFPTIDDFIKYVEEFYPQSYAIDFDDIDRYNNIYVLRVKILDYNATAQDEPLIQRVVIRENNYNDYVVSFQVEKSKN